MERSTSAGPAGLDAALTVLDGIGPVRAASLERLGVSSVRDLLLFVPRGLERREGRKSIAEARTLEGREVCVAGKLGPPSLFRRGRRRAIVRAVLRDGAESLPCVFFNQPWVRERLASAAREGATIELAGKIVQLRSGPALTNPRFVAGGGEGPAEGEEPGLRAVYPLTRGIGQELLRRVAARAAHEYGRELVEPLPGSLLGELGLPPLAAAVAELHAPTDVDAHDRARRRAAFEALLALQARMARAERSEDGRARPIPGAEGRFDELCAHLSFAPTAGQRSVLAEVGADLARRRPMRRLLQGEVGSGKTLVAVCAAYAVAAAGGQVALMAPTEVLAEQHRIGLAPLLDALGVRTVLLTGSLSARERRTALAALADGTARLAIGTHALFSSDVRFARLDLVVIDEQQRFGVVHKRSLLEKGRDVHVLLATATPIPRTLALTLYGDLDESRLEGLPPGRGRLGTRVLAPGERGRALAFAEERMRAGERVFWVCPRIGSDDGDSEDEEEEAAAAGRVHAELASGPLGELGVVLVHGRLSPQERSTRIERFRSGAARLCVCTTIVEVGVDVPEATLMVVEGAERFGLAQLHQLRGRVGRGPRDAWCVLLGSPSEQRLRFLEGCDDGFAIAEEDLRRRGMGDLAGLRQAGDNLEGLGDPAADVELLLAAHRVVREDPEVARAYAGGPTRPPATV